MDYCEDLAKKREHMNFSRPFVLCLVHVILTEGQMMNLVLNVCFDFLADIKSRSESNTNY